MTNKKTLQSGFILQVVLFLLVMAIMGGLYFFEKTSSGTSMAILEKDMKKAELLAESGINRVLGRFVSQEPTVWDINGDGIRDAEQVMPISLVTPSLPLGVNYVFYATSDKGANPIDQTFPKILQSVANGESSDTNGVGVDNQALSASLEKIKVSQLFMSASVHPLLFVQGNDNLLESQNNWETEESREKVAVFFELVKNEENPEWLDVYANAVVQIGSTKKYVQRFVGSYTSTLGGLLAPLNESSNHG